MKVVILAGGYGTRLSEYTKTIPKPMINVGGKPIIFHIMKHYSNYGFKDFYIALGYKGEIIKKFFKKNFKTTKTPKVLYGGSVNSKNIKLFSSITDIDGFLIGGASQSSKKFIDIIKNYYK